MVVAWCWRTGCRWMGEGPAVSTDRRGGLRPSWRAVVGRSAGGNGDESCFGGGWTSDNLSGARFECISVWPFTWFGTVAKKPVRAGGPHAPALIADTGDISGRGGYTLHLALAARDAPDLPDCALAAQGAQHLPDSPVAGGVLYMNNDGVFAGGRASG